MHLESFDWVSKSSEVSLVFRWGKIGPACEGFNEYLKVLVDRRDRSISQVSETSIKDCCSIHKSKLYVNWSARGSYSFCDNPLV